MIQTKTIKTLLVVGVIVILGMFAGKLIAINNSFSAPSITAGGHIVRIDPVAEIMSAGTQFGLPLFEMRDEFFIRIAHRCGSKVEIIKNGKITLASDPYHSDGICFQTFRSEAPMMGSFTINLLHDRKRYSEVVAIQRTKRLSCPLWDMLMSA